MAELGLNPELVSYPASHCLSLDRRLILLQFWILRCGILAWFWPAGSLVGWENISQPDHRTLSAVKVCHMQSTFESQRQRVTVGWLHPEGVPQWLTDVFGYGIFAMERFLKGNQPTYPLTGTTCVIGNWVGGFFPYLVPHTKPGVSTIRVPAPAPPLFLWPHHPHQYPNSSASWW